jgi:hypothetical protein
MSSIAQAHVTDVTSSAKVAQRKNPHVIPPIGMYDAEPTTPRRDQTQSGTQAPDRRRSWLAPPPTPATPGASSDFGWFVSASPAPMSPREKFSPDDPFSSDTPPIFSPRHATRWRRWITSTVIADPRDWCDESLLVMHEAIRLDLERADSALAHLRADADGRAAWKLENFFTWFREYHCPNVRHHRDAKEQIYVPWIESHYELPPPAREDHTLRAAGRVFSPSKLAADHEAQLKQVQMIDGLFTCKSTFGCCRTPNRSCDHQEPRAYPDKGRTNHQQASRCLCMAQLCGTAGEKLNRWATEALITSLQMEWKQYRALTEAHFAKEEALVPALLRSGKFTVDEKAATVGKILEV